MLPATGSKGLGDFPCELVAGPREGFGDFLELCELAAGGPRSRLRALLICDIDQRELHHSDGATRFGYSWSAVALWPSWPC